jgi:probable HAF family extracellular repeat protein
MRHSILLLALLFMALPACFAPPEDLGTLPGGSESAAYDINEHGVVVGSSETDGGETHAAMWIDGEIVDLGTLGGENSWARGVNNLNQVVGVSETADGARHGFLWINGIMWDLHAYAPFEVQQGGAYAVNDELWIAGTTELSAVVWKGGLFYENLASTFDGPRLATDINLYNEISGSALSSEFVTRWANGTFTTLTGHPDELCCSQRGNALNSQGWVAGRAITRDAPGSPVRNVASVFRDGVQGYLLKTFTESFAYDINDLSWVVGEAENAAGDTVPFIWLPTKDSAQLLPTLGGFDGAARAVNTKGDVVGYSDRADGRRRATLWAYEGF